MGVGDGRHVLLLGGKAAGGRHDAGRTQGTAALAVLRVVTDRALEGSYTVPRCGASVITRIR